MRRRDRGFTLIELTVVLAILAVIVSALLPTIHESIRNARIEGAVTQAKGIIEACHLARVKPVSSIRDPNNIDVTHVYNNEVTSWTNISHLNTVLVGNHFLPANNPFGRPYLYKMTNETCMVAVELDSTIDGWQGLAIETSGSFSKIIVNGSSANGNAPEWVKQQKQFLSGETSR